MEYSNLAGQQKKLTQKKVDLENQRKKMSRELVSEEVGDENTPDLFEMTESIKQEVNKIQKNIVKLENNVSKKASKYIEKKLQEINSLAYEGKGASNIGSTSVIAPTELRIWGTEEENNQRLQTWVEIPSKKTS